MDKISKFGVKFIVIAIFLIATLDLVFVLALGKAGLHTFNHFMDNKLHSVEAIADDFEKEFKAHLKGKEPQSINTTQPLYWNSYR